MWMENDKVEIPEKYLNMSPEELKQAKEEKYERIKVQQSEISRGIAKSREHHFVDPTIEALFVNLLFSAKNKRVVEQSNILLLIQFLL